MSGLSTSESTTDGLSPTGSDPIVQRQVLATEVETTIESQAGDQSVDSWRAEVAARLERYRTRRKPRTPRYPSLLLPFEAPESWSRPSVSGGTVTVAAASDGEEQGFESPTVQLSSASEPGRSPEPGLAEPQSVPELVIEQNSHAYSETSAKVIEFPRSAAIPVFHASELAEPVFDFDRPRIVEAPEILPPPPALGGMLIEPLQQEAPERRADSALLKPCSSIGWRVAAALMDGILVASCAAGFAALVFRLTAVQLPLPLIAGTGGVVAVLLWAAYEFLFIVYTGSTPGLRVARLRLTSFDGSPLNRRRRRWRVLASLLSAFSAGLGYLWSFLDEDGLCWHDRITRSCVVSTPKEK
jgi:uncharacterized RDD family membrane protein YckC